MRLRKDGYDVVAAAELPELRGRADEALLDLAAAERRVLVTRDVATVRPLLHDRWAAGRPTWGAIFVPWSVPAAPSGRGVLLAALRLVLRSRPDDAPLDREVWIGVSAR